MLDITAIDYIRCYALLKMEQELNWLIEKIEELDTKIAYILDDGYTKEEIPKLIKDQEMLSNILNAMTLKELS